MNGKDLVEISEKGAKEILLLAAKDPQSGERTFNSLSFPQKMCLILSCRGKEREKLIIMANDADRIVQSLPEEEFYYTIKEIGEKDASALLSLASAEQITFCFDIEGWKKDRVNHKRLLDWWEVILSCGDDKTYQLIKEMDEELLITFFKGYIKVAKPGIEIEGVEIDDDWFTLDNQYYVKFKNPKRSEKIFSHILELIFREDYDLYFRIMEGVLWGIPAEQEELAFRWRQSRLMDKGFPDLYESLEIYRWLDPSMLRIDEGAKDLSDPDERMKKWAEIAPNFYLAPQSSGSFFSQALNISLEQEGMENLKGELVYLCNKVMVAEGVDVSQLEEVREALANVYHYLNLGLSHLAKGDVQEGVRGLKKLYLQQIFQVGYSLTLRLRREAEKILRDSWFPDGKNDLTLLDFPYYEVMEGILRPKPTFFEGLIDPNSSAYRTFRELKEIHITEEKMEEIKFLLRLHREIYGFSPELIRRTDLEGCHPRDWREITLSTITLTSFANQILKARFEFSPLRQQEVKSFLIRSLEEDGKGGVLPKLREDFVLEAKAYLNRLMKGCPENEKERAWMFWQRCLEELKEEFGYLDITRRIDPRFTKGLLIGMGEWR
ncbi:MAG: hypothetical protein DRG50_05105 [Deltaproteobacteria bacterium]|nr:MAG: hypothetical protein DRG50_05105 [Deltaproteobacteria bacterium]